MAIESFPLSYTKRLVGCFSCEIYLFTSLKSIYLIELAFRLIKGSEISFTVDPNVLMVLIGCCEIRLDDEDGGEGLLFKKLNNEIKCIKIFKLTNLMYCNYIYK